LFDYYMKNRAKYVAGAGPWNRLVATGEEMPMEVVTPSDSIDAASLRKLPPSMDGQA
jgi:hypothetical protein